MTPGLVVLAPLVCMVLLPVLPARAAGWANLAVALLTFLLAARLPFAVDSGGWFLLDGLAVHMAVLTAFVGLTTAWFSRGYMAAETALGRLSGRAMRLYHACFQAVQGSVLLALLSDNLGVAWMAMEAATIAAVLAVALPGTASAVGTAWRFLILAGVGLALALFGIIVLYLAAQPALEPGWAAMSWTGLQRAAAGCQGAVLNLAFAMLLVGFGAKAALVPMHAWMPDSQAEGPTPVTAILASGIINAALILLLRTRGVLSANASANAGAIDPGGPLMAVGLISVLMAALALWQLQDAKRFLAMSSVQHGGLAAIAFGLGGPVALYAGVLHLTGHTLAKAAAFQCVGRGAQWKGGQRFTELSGLLPQRAGVGLPLLLAMAALAGLPPGSLFVSELLTVITGAQQRPAWALILTVALGAGLLTGAWCVLARGQHLAFGPRTADRGPAPGRWDLAGAWANLLAVLALGVLMPAPLAAWFQHVVLGLR